MGAALRRVEAIGRQFDQEAERIREIDRVHEAAILDVAVLDLPLVEPRYGLQESRAGNREGHMMYAAGLSRGTPRIRLARLLGEDRDQAAVARIEIKMAFVGRIQIGLLENERHAQHAFPKIDRGLSVRSHQRDVMDSLRLNLSHRHRLPLGRRINSLCHPKWPLTYTPQSQAHTRSRVSSLAAAWCLGVRKVTLSGMQINVPGAQSFLHSCKQRSMQYKVTRANHVGFSRNRHLQPSSQQVRFERMAKSASRTGAQSPGCSLGFICVGFSDACVTKPSTRATTGVRE